VQNTIAPKVYIVGRSAPAAERIIKECQTLNKDGKVEFMQANVTELAEVDRVCKEIEKKEEKINLLVQTQGNLTLAGRNGTDYILFFVTQHKSVLLDLCHFN
jgi:NADP-dependent 3-hydroxy acid dehydrogenase YdfG